MTSPLVDTTSLKKSDLLSKCSSKELYSLQVSLIDFKTLSQIYFEKGFQNKEIEWKFIYTLCFRMNL